MIKIRGLNPNETYCCTKQDVLRFFDNAEDMSIDFGYSGFQSRNEKRDGYLNRRSCEKQFKVIARMDIYDKGGINLLSGKTFLSFYILNKEDFVSELIQKFKIQMLPQLFQLYSKYKNSDIISQSEMGIYTAEVVWHGENLIIKEKLL